MNQNEQQILTRALFCHAAHSGSLSEAARVLGVDRGSVRNLIRSLESEVGESLLTRSTAGRRKASLQPLEPGGRRA